MLQPLGAARNYSNEAWFLLWVFALFLIIVIIIISVYLDKWTRYIVIIVNADYNCLVPKVCKTRHHRVITATFTLEQIKVPGIILPFTHKTRIRKLLNPEFKVETLYPETGESETFRIVNRFFNKSSYF